MYKVASAWSGCAWITDTTLAQSYVWGIDIGSDGLDAIPAGHLASPFSRAGGVGGSVLARFHQEPTAEQEHFPCYDGNGNVLALIAAKHNGNTTAAYDYEPFGNTVSATGDPGDTGAYGEGCIWVGTIFQITNQWVQLPFFPAGYPYVSPEATSFTINRHSIAGGRSMLKTMVEIVKKHCGYCTVDAKLNEPPPLRMIGSHPVQVYRVSFTDQTPPPPP